MPANPLDRTILAAIVAMGALVFMAGAGWAMAGDAIFLSHLMAGFASCF
jgi:hypothetical protein